MTDNASERVRVEDFVAMRRRAEDAEARLQELQWWVLNLVPVAGTYRSARKTIERIVRDAY